jgi:uncharacterized membrane protein (UPF0127 family)
MTACLARPRRHALQPSFAAALLALALLAGCTDSRPAVVIEPKSGKPVTVFVEVADTPDAQTRGLMYRTHLDPDHGMVFLFDAETDRSFWMKNTPLPLDMIFISRDGHIVGIHPNAEPFALKTIGVGAPSQVVLEVNGGFAAAHALAAGDRVTYRNISSTKIAAR